MIYIDYSKYKLFKWLEWKVIYNSIDLQSPNWFTNGIVLFDLWIAIPVDVSRYIWHSKPAKYESVGYIGSNTSATCRLKPTRKEYVFVQSKRTLSEVLLAPGPTGFNEARLPAIDCASNKSMALRGRTHTLNQSNVASTIVKGPPQKNLFYLFIYFRGGGKFAIIN